MTHIFKKLKLRFNPFEPSATGAPLGSELTLSKELSDRVHTLLERHDSGQGVKTLMVVGEYGIGKTCLLQWLHRHFLPERRIKSFYFDNPGVHFYDLANALLRNIGRKDFAKFVWELAGPKVETVYQTSLFQSSFEEYLSAVMHRRQYPEMTRALQEAIIRANVTSDGEIANCLARIVMDSKQKPYFEYRDFMPRIKGSVVPEAEEAPYFQALLRTILQGEGASAMAFLVDEFEEIGLQKRLTRRASYDYLATLKRLVNLTPEQSD